MKDNIKIGVIRTYTETEYKSVLTFGNCKILNTKHFNWLNKKMFKLLMGIEIIDYKGEEL